MIKINNFGEVTQFRLGRAIEEDGIWGPAGKVLYWVAAYLVDGLLIDTGPPHTAREFAGCLHGRHIKFAINTHFHEDHIGANHILQNEFRLRILASAESIPLINQVPKLEPYEELVWGRPVPTLVEQLPDGIKTDLYCFEVIKTPGHSRDHVCLLEHSQGWCFSGDLFTSKEQKVLWPYENIVDIADSMLELANRGRGKMVLFTSLGNVIEDGREALKACVAHFHRVARRAKELSNQGLLPEDIRDDIFGRDSVLSMLTNGAISSLNLIKALLQTPEGWENEPID